MATVVDRFREIILSGHSVEDGYLPRLRAAGWTSASGHGPVYGYIDFHFIDGTTNCAGNPNFAGRTTTWTSWDGDFCNLVNPHESWFLHNTSGQRITGNGGYAMNPTVQGWRDYMANKVARYFASEFPGLDGIFLDDLWANKSSTPNCADCPSDAAWHDGTMQDLQAIRAAMPAGKRLTYNSSPGDTSQAGYAGLADGFMVEMLGTGWCDGCWESQASIEQHLSDTDSEVAAGGDVLLVGQGDSSGSIQQMRFSHALYLMVAGPHVSYRFGNAGSYQWWDYPEYGWNLGTPLGPRVKPVATVFQRTFSNGAALANMGTSSVTINLGGTYILPDGSSATSVTLGAHQGVALRR